MKTLQPNTLFEPATAPASRVETDSVHRGRPQKTVGIFLFPDVEPLDFVGPYEVFAAARHTLDSDERLCQVRTVAEQEGVIACRYGLQIVPDESIAHGTAFDVLVLPGGRGTPAAAERSRVLEWIRRQTSGAEYVVSVCTGCFLLAEAGLLRGLPSTTHWASLDRLQREHPETFVRRNVRWVDNGRILTSAGVSAGIDVSLHVVRRLFGNQAASATARGIEYSSAKQD